MPRSQPTAEIRANRRFQKDQCRLKQYRSAGGTRTGLGRYLPVIHFEGDRIRSLRSNLKTGEYLQSA